MDMSNPVGAVISTLDGPVLNVLAGTTSPLTGRRVHQLAMSGSERGVRNALHRLSETGLVDAAVVGAAVQYALNRDHLAANAVLELTSLRSRLFDRLRDVIGAWPTKPIHASVFGSTARGDGDLHSDIDLLVVHEFKATDDLLPAWENQLSELAEHTQRWTGNHLQIYDLSTRDLLAHLAAAEPIVGEWKRDAITVHGSSIRTVINQLDAGGRGSAGRPDGLAD